ncbi:MAG: PD-(D/E)XK nuclease family protein, partial [Bdellovibrionota bacterium]
LRKLHVLGLPPDWLEGERVGDFWFNERDREILAADFAIRTRFDVAGERARALREWAQAADELVICDSSHGFDGSEREELQGAMLRVSESLGCAVPEVVIGQPRAERLASFELAHLSAPPREVRLPRAAGGASANALRATELDQYSRCAFRSLPSYRWGLEELEEPDIELWVRERGTLLHRAARHMVSDRLGAREAVERAWTDAPPRGMIRSLRAREHAKARLTRVMERFAEQEAAYQLRTEAHPLWLDDHEIDLEFGGIRVKGRPDRVDEVGTGVFVMDYKTGGDHPQGTDTLAVGYGLQLPLYAIAAARETGKPALGAQFVELSRGGTRARGLLFKSQNGKEPGKVSHSRSKLSVLEADPELVWDQCSRWITDHAQAWASGIYDAAPKFSDDCETCPVSDVCGARRRRSLS